MGQSMSMLLEAGPYVSMTEQCQNARRVRSACAEHKALGWLKSVSLERILLWDCGYLVMSA
jgi:hypothetical protein